MDIEYSPHSVIECSPHSVVANFWCQVYLKAMETGHKDAAAVADAAFVDFESRFGLRWTIRPESKSACEQVQGTAIGGPSARTYVGGPSVVDAAVGVLAQAGIMASDAERMRDAATDVLAGAQNAMLPGVVIGDGPSIEAGDAPPLEHGWQAGHVAPEEGDLG